MITSRRVFELTDRSNKVIGVPSNKSGAATIIRRMCCHMWTENSTPS
jgi:hypothetical protein